MSYFILILLWTWLYWLAFDFLNCFFDIFRFSQNRPTGGGIFFWQRKCYQPLFWHQRKKILVLLSASVERLAVSRMRDFFSSNRKLTQSFIRIYYCFFWCWLLLFTFFLAFSLFPIFRGQFSSVQLSKLGYASYTVQ